MPYLAVAACGLLIVGFALLSPGGGGGDGGDFGWGGDGGDGD